jgi:hypothetical protein
LAKEDVMPVNYGGNKLKRQGRKNASGIIQRSSRAFIKADPRFGVDRMTGKNPLPTQVRQRDVATRGGGRVRDTQMDQMRRGVKYMQAPTLEKKRKKEIKTGSDL